MQSRASPPPTSARTSPARRRSPARTSWRPSSAEATAASRAGVGCPIASETQTAESTEQLARGYFERVAARDPDGMMEFWESGGIGHIHGVTKLRAPDGYREWFKNLFAAFPDMRFEVVEIVADETRAAVRWRIDADFNGTVPFEGLMPTGAHVEGVEGIDLLTIRDGKIVSLEAYMNGMQLARQMGAMPPQGSPAERGMFGLLNLKTRAVRALRRS